jgi:hypothetical protein
MPFKSVYPNMIPIGSKVQIRYPDGRRRTGVLVDYTEYLDSFGLPQKYFVQLPKTNKTALVARKQVYMQS